MHDYERSNEELLAYYSYTSSLLSFLQKYVTQFRKALNTYSKFLQHFHSKTTDFLLETNSNHEHLRPTHDAFLSGSQALEDEHQQLEQRAKLLQMIQSAIENLNEQIHSPSFSKQKRKLHKYTSRIGRLHRQKKRYQLIQQARKHHHLTVTWKTHLDSITSQVTYLLWQAFSYSHYKFDTKSMTTSSDSLANNNTTGDFSSPLHLGFGDQSHSKSIEDNLLYEPQREISNSNNALLTPGNVQETSDDIRSLHSTEIDEVILENNRWISFVKGNTVRQQQTTYSISSDQSNPDSERIIKQNDTRIQTKDSLHLSDISYTTDYYSQNDSD